MFTLVYKGNIIEYTYDKNNIHIGNSNTISAEVDMKAILKIITTRASKRGIVYNRTMTSWIREWKAHNLLYNNNYKVSRTGSVDLNEDESVLRRIGYFILSLFYKN